VVPDVALDQRHAALRQHGTVAGDAAAAGIAHALTRKKKARHLGGPSSE
jgi:hypothetical protein